MGSNDEEEGEVNTKLSFKSIGLKAFIQKMNNRRRAHMKSIKRIHSQRSQFNSDDYDTNAGNEASEYYKVNKLVCCNGLKDVMFLNEVALYFNRGTKQARLI